MSDVKTIKDVIDILKGDWSETANIDYVNCGWGLVKLEEYFRGNPKDVLHIQYNGVAICDRVQFEGYIETLIRNSTEGYYINTVKDAYENLKDDYRENIDYKFVVYNKDSGSFSFYPDDDVEDHIYVVCSMKELIEYANSLNKLKGEDMKTVKDAYEFFGGNLINLIAPFKAITFNSNGGFYSIKDSDITSSGDYQVCTQKEFEDYAKMQKLKGGDMEVKTVADAVSAYNGIFPDERCDLYDYWELPHTGILSFKGLAICTRQEFKDYINRHDKTIAALATLENLGYKHNGGELWKPPIANTETNKVKPVYTQEMADNGELPPVGFKCLIEFNENNWQEFKLITETRFSLFCCVDDKEIVIPKDARLSFKLIDTRTDKEKLIDELKSCLLLSDEKACGDKVDFAHFEQHSNDLLDKFDIKLK